MFVIILIISVICFIFLLSGKGPNKRVTCDQQKQLHKWIYMNQDGNEYMVCGACKLLPGGNFEEKEF